MEKDRFEGSFQKFNKLILYYVNKKTSDQRLAEEILQHVFCEFFIHMDEIDPAAEKTWLLCCTRNAVIDHLRRKQHYSEVLFDPGTIRAELLLTHGNAASMEERLDLQELVTRILQNLEQVNVLWYEVIALCFVEGLSYAEAADVLHVSTDMVRARISRARAYIRKNFRDEFLEDLG